MGLVNWCLTNPIDCPVSEVTVLDSFCTDLDFALIDKVMVVWPCVYFDVNQSPVVSGVPMYA